MRNQEVGSFDADFLRNMTDEEEFPVKRLAQITGKAIDTIYRYRRGELGIPLKFWRDVFAATKDIRIIFLLIGNVDCELVLTDRVPDLRGDAALFKEALESIERFHAEQKYFAEITKDGRIDETDRDAMKHYREHFMRSRMQSLALFRAVNRAFETSVAAAT